MLNCKEMLKPEMMLRYSVPWSPNGILYRSSKLCRFSYPIDSSLIWHEIGKGRHLACTSDSVPRSGIRWLLLGIEPSKAGWGGKYTYQRG